MNVLFHFASLEFVRKIIGARAGSRNPDMCLFPRLEAGEAFKQYRKDLKKITDLLG